MKLQATVYDLTDSHSGVSAKDGKPYAFHKQSCQINTGANLPDVPFSHQVKDENSFLKAGVYEFDLIPRVGKYGSIDWDLKNPRQISDKLS